MHVLGTIVWYLDFFVNEIFESGQG
jgi:hypothetical protein